MTSITMEKGLNRGAVQTEEISAYTASFGLSLGLTSVFNGLLVVVKETNDTTVLAWMKVAGNHWVTQGALDVVVFVVLGLLLARNVENWRTHPNSVTATAIGGVVVGSLIIALFNLRQIF
jgi:hypothetical protein